MRGHLAVEKLEREQLKLDLPDFRPGDTIRVDVLVREGERERIQAFEGVCIRRANGSVGETITVRKISYGVGVERTFHLHSPLLANIVVKRRGKARRARLYYLRDRVGKSARIRKERMGGQGRTAGRSSRLSAAEATAAAQAALASQDPVLDPTLDTAMTDVAEQASPEVQEQAVVEPAADGDNQEEKKD